MRYIFSDELRQNIVSNKLVKKSDIIELFKKYSIVSDFYNYINYHKDYKVHNISFKQLVYHFLMDDTINFHIPKCLYCNNEVNRFYPHKMEYAPYCCKKCSDLSPLKHQHESETCLQKYGKTRWTNREKAKETCRQKYGENITNPSQIQEVKEKKKETTQLHYGVDNPGQIHNHKEKCKKSWDKKDKKEKEKISKNRHLHTDYLKRTQNTINSLQQKYGENVTNISQLDSVKQKKSSKKDISLKKARKTASINFRKNYEYMKSTYNLIPKRGVFSKIELNFYEYLLSKFNKNDIIPQYSNEDLYPFNCDFFIVPLNLFVEIQGTWTHGFHPFDKNNQYDIDTINFWKSKKSKYYDKAIEVWTHSDVIKRECAKNNHLNYLEIFTKDINIAINKFEEYLKKYEKVK